MPPPHLDGRNLSVAVQVEGCVAPLVGAGPKPALVFRFTTADGTELLPIVLVMEDVTARQLAELVHAQVHTAMAKARAFRSLS